jgi:hypothetical protein
VYIPIDFLSGTDPLAVAGTDSLSAGIIVAAVILACCCIMGFVYYRRVRKQQDPNLLSPYEKWMMNEAAKQQGVEVSFANKRVSTFDAGGKDASRLNKLHTKHGVSMDRRKTLEVVNPLADDAEFGDLYGTEDDHKVAGGMWLDADAPIHENPFIGGSTHNPMNASQHDEKLHDEMNLCPSAIYEHEEEFVYDAEAADLRASLEHMKEEEELIVTPPAPPAPPVEEVKPAAPPAPPAPKPAPPPPAPPVVAAAPPPPPPPPPTTPGPEEITQEPIVNESKGSWRDKQILQDKKDPKKSNPVIVGGSDKAMNAWDRPGAEYEIYKKTPLMLLQGKSNLPAKQE